MSRNGAIVGWTLMSVMSIAFFNFFGEGRVGGWRSRGQSKSSDVMSGKKIERAQSYSHRVPFAVIAVVGLGPESSPGRVSVRHLHYQAPQRCHANGAGLDTDAGRVGLLVGAEVGAVLLDSGLFARACACERPRGLRCRLPTAGPTPL